MEKLKVIASKEGLTDIILILNKKSVIEEYAGEVKAKNRWFQRKEELKQQGRLITHEIDVKPVKRKGTIRRKIMGRPMRLED